MAKLAILNTLSGTVHRAGFQIKKHSPEILITAGVIGTVSAAVMACRATYKLKAVMDKSAEQIEAVHYCTENGYTIDPETEEKIPYTEEDSKRDLTIAYAHTVVDVVKLYAPAVILGGLSIAAVITSSHIQRQRTIAAAAAYASLNKQFKAYSGRVIERFGEGLDKELRYGVKAQEIEVTETDENGEEKTVTKIVNAVDPNEFGEYTFFFDEYCPGWQRDAEFNKMTLKQIQTFCNKKLQEQGYLFLNDVLKEIGLPFVRHGQYIGWIYDEKNHIGDNFIDFGLYNAYNEATRDFMNGREYSVLLDFNCDGPILDLL